MIFSGQKFGKLVTVCVFGGISILSPHITVLVSALSRLRWVRNPDVNLNELFTTPNLLSLERTQVNPRLYLTDLPLDMIRSFRVLKKSFVIAKKSWVQVVPVGVPKPAGALHVNPAFVNTTRAILAKEPIPQNGVNARLSCFISWCNSKQSISVLCRQIYTRKRFSIHENANANSRIK